MNDLMLDIETLGTGHNAVITQIGAVYFIRNTGQALSQFQTNIQIQDALNEGLEIDGSALKFWFEQGIERMTWLKEPVCLSKALENFRQFCMKDTLAWSHATFDFPILTNAYNIFNSKLPIPYRNLRDIRTLIDLSNLPYNKPKTDKTHDALDDCLYQIKYCKEAFNLLREKQHGQT